MHSAQLSRTTLSESPDMEPLLEEWILSLSQNVRRLDAESARTSVILTCSAKDIRGRRTQCCLLELLRHCDL